MTSGGKRAESAADIFELQRQARSYSEAAE